MSSSTYTEELWVCPKCNSTNRETLIFCLNCATQEGSPDNQVTGKISETLAKAIEWSLQNALFKPPEIIEQAVKQGLAVKTIPELQKYPNLSLEKLANRFVGINQTAATGAGFGAGLPGGLAAFATIPADIAAVIYFAQRCISGIGQAYGFTIEAEKNKTLKLLSFAFACQLETVVIGGRRFELFDLARYFQATDYQHAPPVLACLLKQLAAFLTRDFAKTTWATFLPVVGGFINGVDNFWYVREVSKRAKIFYSGLLSQARPATTSSASAEPVEAIPPPALFELPGYSIELAEGALEVELIYTERVEPVPLVVLMWSGSTGRYVAEQLAEKGYAALLPVSSLTAPGLAQLLVSLRDTRPDFFPPDVHYKQAGLLAAGDFARLALTADLTGAGVVALVNPSGAALEATVVAPTLLHWSENDTTLDSNWLQTVQAVKPNGLISIATYPTDTLDFINPYFPSFNRQAAGWFWSDTFSWLEALR